MSTLRTDLRNGPYGRRHWCLIHRTWWKLCPCPGHASLTTRLDPASPDNASLNRWLDDLPAPR